MSRPLRVPPVVPALLACAAIGAVARGALGDWTLYPVLGVFPGVALATLLPLERGAFARWTLGVAISPLVTALAAWGLMAAGLPLPAAARVLAVAATLAWAATEWAVAPRADAAQALEGTRFAWNWALGSAAVIGFVMFVNPYLQVRVDAWVHGGIVWEILERGIPPQDPRFAGLTLNYVWFHNYFVALLASLHGGDPFGLMAISNTGSMFATMGLAWLIGRDLWGSTRAAAGSALLMGLGMNGGVWLLWPIRIAKALFGRVHGPAQVAEVLDHMHWNDARVIFDLTPLYAYMVNFLDKPLHGTAINAAYVFMLLYLWAMVRALDGARGPALFWGAIATAGMFFFHGVVGLSVVPVALASLALAWLLAGRWTLLPSRSRLAAFAGASVGGTLIAAPYTIAISKAWPASKSGLHQSYLQPDPSMWFTLATSLALTAWIGRRALPRLFAERRGGAAVLAVWSLGMLVFASVVVLPLGSQAKFVFEVFAGAAVLAGVAFHDELASWKRRFGAAGAFALGAVLLAGTPAITLRGYLLDRSGTTAPENNPVRGESEAYAWMRASTPPSAVFVDRNYRNIIMVRAHRQLLLGSPLGPELAAFPLDETLRRRAVMADLFGRGDSLDRDAARMAALRRPGYVLLRAADADSGGSPAPRLDARPDLFSRVYDRDGFIVYHVKLTDPTSHPTPSSPRP